MRVDLPKEKYLYDSRLINHLMVGRNVPRLTCKCGGKYLKIKGRGNMCPLCFKKKNQ